MSEKYIQLTRPDGGKVYIRRDAIDRVLQTELRTQTQVFVCGAVQYVRETAEDIMRDIN